MNYNEPLEDDDFDNNDNEPFNDSDSEDDSGSEYSWAQQRAADLSDYSDDLLRSGSIDAIQAAEIRAGA
jgi:hypothetical protein